MNKTIAPAIPVLLFLCFVITGKPNSMKPFGWLEGNWSMKTKRGIITESWKTNHDSSMLGDSKMILSTGEERLLENLELARQGDSYYYVSRVNGQNNGEAVRFKISMHDETGFVAENPGHDFPKRITYRLVNTDSIHAFIDGGSSKPEKRSDFYYSRQKN